MCSILAPGQSGFINRNGQKDPHFADQLPLFEKYECKEDAVSQKQINQLTKQSINLSSMKNIHFFSIFLNVGLLGFKQ